MAQIIQKRQMWPRLWLNSIWLILFLIYTSVLVIFLQSSKIPDNLFEDYRAFYASAEIAATRGFNQVYDLQVQSQVQSDLQQENFFGTYQTPKETVPMPYLPVFVLLFLPLKIAGYKLGYYLWVSFNVLLLLGYLVRMVHIMGKEIRRDLLIQLVVSLPVLSNFLLGQINVLLLICLSEFFYAYLNKREHRAGLWLGGLLLKPQALIFILPGLLIQKRYKALAGFAISGLFLIGLSLLLGGPHSMVDLFLLLLKYVHGLPSNAPEVMMNWRALATHLSIWLPDSVTWGLAFMGMGLTTYLALSLWFLPVDSRSPDFGLLLLATFAGTFSVAWHTHNHMQMILIPLVFFLDAQKLIPWKIIYLLILVPPLFTGVMVLLAPDQAYALFGLLMMGINMILLVWAARNLRSKYASTS